MKAISSSQTQRINLTYITILNLPEIRHSFCEKELASLSNSWSKAVDMPPLGVQLFITERQVTMDNGIVQVTLSNPDGIVTGIQYGGVDNVLEVLNDESNRGYWDLVWSSSSSTTGLFDVIKAKGFEVIVENEEQVELSFTRTWDLSLEGKLVPLEIDKRFIMLRGSSGFYSYAIYQHLEEWPGFNLGETRLAFKLRKDKFHYMAMADNRQRYMPLPDDRSPPRGRALAYPEAVLLVDPIEPEFQGEVFISAHYAGQDLLPKIGAGEAWKKVFGPVFIYLNSTYDSFDALQLWEDAKAQAVVEVQSWPYSFPASDDFPRSNQRSNISGKLLVKDSYVNEDLIPADGAFVGLAPPGDVGSWQRESKGYQFWSRADESGNFSIDGVRPGDYNLYAWVPGFIGDYRYDALINLTEGSEVDIGDITYEPPRQGATLWEIGIPDRSAAEFYVPDPNPNYVNKLYLNHPDKFRQYGLWERYSELFPDSDLVYTVGVSDYTKDWFFAQVPRKMENGTYKGTTWQVKFELDNVDNQATYKLRVALASASLAELQVGVNDAKAKAVFSSGLIGRDNSIARHGIHGLYWVYNIDIPGNRLVTGNNTIFFTQPRGTGPFQAIMYDYIRLEAPPPPSSAHPSE